MSSLGFCLIDGNNLGFRAQNANKLTVGDMETQAIFGMLRTVRQIVMTHHMLTPIVLWDGVSWRKKLYPDYKANRDKTPTTAHERIQAAGRDSYKRQRPYITKGLKHLAVRQMVALNMEADDLAGILVKRFKAQRKKVILITADRDWIQLVGAGVSWHDPISDRQVRISNFQEQTGYHNPRAFLEGKALQGDPSDNIPGVGGIGEKGAVELVTRFGSVNTLLNMWIAGEIDAQGRIKTDPEAKKLPKKVLTFLDESQPGREAFARNLQLMDLAIPSMPEPYGLRLDHGKFDREAFADLCAEFAFKSILNDLDGWMEPFKGSVAEAA